jgi:hypothetical protein
MKLLNKYVNGNYTVRIYSDGTKIRETEADEFNASFPENIDIKITNWCNMGCPFCHENSTINGKHADLFNSKFIDTLHSGTELAIGGGMVTSHTDLIPFLQILKNKGIISNITVHQFELEKNIELIEGLVAENLIYGIGVSYKQPSEIFTDIASKFKNCVIHTINGVHTKSDFEYLSNKNLKVLILGYKELRRGANYFEKESELINTNKMWLYENLKILLPKFKVVSFDNLSLKQLEVQRLLSKEQWDNFYMGDDGQYTMYIDLVEKQYAKNSTSLIRHELSNNIYDMFSTVKRE